jgi:hypothetical protein
MGGFQKFCSVVGFHPLVGFGMFAIDWMLFGGTMATAGAGWCVAAPVALLLGIPSALLQRYSFGDNWGVALAKGAMIGLVTAIPTALPSVVSLAGGSLGAASLMLPRKSEDGKRPVKRIAAGKYGG